MQICELNCTTTGYGLARENCEVSPTVCLGDPRSLHRKLQLQTASNNLQAGEAVDDALRMMILTESGWLRPTAPWRLEVGTRWRTSSDDGVIR